MKQSALRLQRCYACLQDDSYDQDRILAACSQFCSLANLWLIKPKHHGAMEVCLQEGSPSLTWTYRDEDMGGYLASLAKLKGGSHNPRSVATSVLQRWRAKACPILSPADGKKECLYALRLSWRFACSDCKEGSRASLLKRISLQVTKFLGQEWCKLTP